MSAARELLDADRGEEQTFPDISLRLAPAEAAARIAGFVLDATGGPVPDALIAASNGHGDATPYATARSNDVGRFELSAKQGSTLLVAEADGYSRATHTVAPPTEDVRLLLVPSSSLAGRVTADGTDEPVPGASVMAVSLNGVLTPGMEAQAGPDGAFQFDGLPTGGYSLWARADGWQDERVSISLGLGEHIEDVVIGLEPAASLVASVHVNGIPCAGASIMLHGSAVFSGLADETGSLQLSNLLPGEYDVAVSCEGGSPIRETLSVAPKERVARSWALEPGRRVRGVARRANGEPLAGVNVHADPVQGADPAASGSPAAAPAMGSSCVTDAAGAFDCTGLAAGTYDVRLAEELQERSPAVRVTLAPDGDADVVLTAHALGSIRARLGEGRAMAAGMRVLAVKNGESLPIVAQYDAGTFLLSDLQLGSYSVYRGTARDQAVRVELARDGQIVEVELPMPPVYEITGRVVDGREQPVPDAWVRAHDVADSAGSAGALAALTDAQGEFTLEGVLEGDYALTASHAQGEATLSRVSAGARGVSIRLPVFGGLAGTVQTSAGKPVPSFVLSYVHESGEGGELPGRDGSWSIDRLAPGRYTVEVDSASGHASGSAVISESGGRADLSLVVTAESEQAHARP